LPPSGHFFIADALAQPLDEPGEPSTLNINVLDGSAGTMSCVASGYAVVFGDTGDHERELVIIVSADVDASVEGGYAVAVLFRYEGWTWD
jgi:hypothetical protein